MHPRHQVDDAVVVIARGEKLHDLLAGLRKGEQHRLHFRRRQLDNERPAPL